MCVLSVQHLSKCGFASPKHRKNKAQYMVCRSVSQPGITKTGLTSGLPARTAWFPKQSCHEDACPMTRYSPAT